MHLHSNSWVAVGASSIGTSHVARQIPCQDSHAGTVVRGTTLVITAADGAGSASQAERGAAFAAQGAVGYLDHELSLQNPAEAPEWQDLFQKMLIHIREGLATLAEGGSGFRMEDFAATLLIAVVTETSVATYQVGDGAIVLRTGSGDLKTLLPGAISGEYVNETTFVTSSAAFTEFAFHLFPAPEISGIALLTDGVQFAAVSRATNEAHGPFFNPVFDFAAKATADTQELSRLLDAEWLNDLTDDDKTLVVAVRKHPEEPLA